MVVPHGSTFCFTFLKLANLKYNNNMKIFIKNTKEKKINDQPKVGVVGIFTLTKRNKAGEIVEQREIKNLVVDSGLNALASAIINGGTVSPISHIAVGDGNTAVSGSDTDLDNLVLKKAKGFQSVSGSIGYVSVQFGFTEANGTIREVGTFVDTNTLFSRISEENSQLPMTKNNTETLTIDYKLAFVNN